MYDRDEIAIERLSCAYDREMSRLFGGGVYDPEDEAQYTPLFAGAPILLKADEWMPVYTQPHTAPADWKENWLNYLTDEEAGRTEDSRKRMDEEIRRAYAE